MFKSDEARKQIALWQGPLHKQAHAVCWNHAPTILKPLRRERSSAMLRQRISVYDQVLQAPGCLLLRCPNAPHDLRVGEASPHHFVG
jgi:hypothetical protein